MKSADSKPAYSLFYTYNGNSCKAKGIEFSRSAVLTPYIIRNSGGLEPLKSFFMAAVLPSGTANGLRSSDESLPGSIWSIACDLRILRMTRSCLSRTANSVDRPLTRSTTSEMTGRLTSLPTSKTG